MCDLNTAAVVEMAVTLDVTMSEAYDLELWRPFSDWEEVATVPGFDSVAVERLRARGASLSPEQDAAAQPGVVDWSEAVALRDAPVHSWAQRPRLVSVR